MRARLSDSHRSSKLCASLGKNGATGQRPGRLGWVMGRAVFSGPYELPQRESAQYAGCASCRDYWVQCSGVLQGGRNSYRNISGRMGVKCLNFCVSHYQLLLLMLFSHGQLRSTQDLAFTFSSLMTQRPPFLKAASSQNTNDARRALLRVQSIPCEGTLRQQPQQQ